MQTLNLSRLKFRNNFASTLRRFEKGATLVLSPLKGNDNYTHGHTATYGFVTAATTTAAAASYSAAAAAAATTAAHAAASAAAAAANDGNNCLIR